MWRFFDLADDLKDQQKAVRERFTKGNLAGVPEPSAIELRKESIQWLLTKRCAGCGGLDHKLEECSVNREPTCEYPHDGIVLHRRHSTLCCPVLHKFCDVCLTMGHFPFVHLKSPVQRPMVELRRRFFKFASSGLFTSLPYLQAFGDGEEVFGRTWKAGFLGQNFRRDSITRYQLRFFRATSLSGPDQVNWVEDVLRPREEQIKKNIFATSVYHMTPIPQDDGFRFYVEALNRGTKRRRIQRPADGEA